MRHPIRSTLRRQPGTSFADVEPLRTSVPKTDEPQERAVLAAILLPDTKADLRDPLAELAALCESVDLIVVDTLIQKRTKPSSVTGFGKGKAQELAERVDMHDADVVVFDNDLTPRQIRNLERMVQCKILDRSELILDIFASRAKTHQAQLQVELAQLEYTAPRLRGMWTHLERIAGAGGGTAAGAVGGVGTRGPGERQIEIDRRIVKRRIAQLKREITEIDRRKQREVQSRGDTFTVSLVGYTNSGKSTLMNRLTDADRFAADLLFATLDTKTARWDFGDGRHTLLSDTVGFVRDLPHGLIASFRATLEETIHADLLLHVVDASSPTALQQVDSVNEVLKELGCENRPRITLLNKIDLSCDESAVELVERKERTTIRVSAKTGEGLDALVQSVEQMSSHDCVDVTVRLPQAEGKLLADLDHHGEVKGRRYADNEVELDVRINRAQLAQFRSRCQRLVVVRGDSDGSDDGDSFDGVG